MADETLRRRLEALNRAPIASAIRERDAGAVNHAAEMHIAPRPRTSTASGLPNPKVSASLTSAPPLPGLLRRGESVQTSVGEHLRICLPVESLWPGGNRLIAARGDFLRQQLARATEAIEPSVAMDGEFAEFVAALPDRMLLLDLETCGLAGSALFLVGMLRQIGDLPMIEMLVARNYAEEPAVLESLWRTLADHNVLVTFNGKSFDWPMVLERTIRHRLRPSPVGPSLHLDVLHHARRRWRRQLPDCRLQTLERLVCRRQRTDDIPGHRIPGVYAEFVRTGFDRDMDTVLYHNAIDLLTLFDLSLRLAV